MTTKLEWLTLLSRPYRARKVVYPMLDQRNKLVHMTYESVYVPVDLLVQLTGVAQGVVDALLATDDLEKDKVTDEASRILRLLLEDMATAAEGAIPETTTQYMLQYRARRSSEAEPWQNVDTFDTSGEALERVQFWMQTYKPHRDPAFQTRIVERTEKVLREDDSETEQEGWQ